ncbi:MAG TPA: hypothetical protein VNA17_00950, partial [Pyrinomonadaceae bacterium]|nr:hypothetical protein [Pyrinomonadaceae bacterium]
VLGNINGGQIVNSLNTLSGNVSLAAGANISITPAGNTLTIASTAAPVNAVLNQTAQQAGANFNIDGTGSANILNGVTQYNLDGNRVLTVTGSFTNTFLGINAGTTTSNFSNTFVGNDAGAFNVSGGINTFVGRRAGYRNTASSNSFFGSDAGQENTSGTRNSYFGTAAGKCVPHGNDNSYFGHDSGAGCSPAASGNSFFGAQTGLSTLGNNNSLFGVEAGRLTQGSDNTFVGAKAGKRNVVGNSNTAIGAQAEVGSPELTNATAIGAKAQVDASDSLVLGSVAAVNGAASDSKVGIGTTQPFSKLHVRSGDLYIDSPTPATALFGVVLTSPGGSCWRITVSDAGALTTISVPCPGLRPGPQK